MSPSPRNSHRAPLRAIDLFCGAGGSSAGARLAGAQILAGFDFWEMARDTYKDNFPEAAFYHGRIEDVDLLAVRRKVGKVNLLLASPECTNHTVAKGRKRLVRSAQLSRMTAFQVIRFAEALEPRWIIVENVIQMKRWSRFNSWMSRLRTLGYNVSDLVINASDVGVPQSRRRLFVLCDREKPVPAFSLRKRKIRAIKAHLNFNGAYKYSLLRTPNRAKPTLHRARQAIKALGTKKPFLLVYYGSDGGGGWQRLESPLRTITTLDRFALVKPGKDGHIFRMLQVPELKAAMGFPKRYKLERGVRRDRIKLLGNAVCPPVMRLLVEKLTGVTRRSGL